MGPQCPSPHTARVQLLQNAGTCSRVFVYQAFRRRLVLIIPLGFKPSGIVLPFCRDQSLYKVFQLALTALRHLHGTATEEKLKEQASQGCCVAWGCCGQLSECAVRCWACRAVLCLYAGMRALWRARLGRTSPAISVAGGPAGDAAPVL